MEALMNAPGWSGGLLFYLLVGGLTGIPAGLFGIGGGLVLVPVLVWFFGMSGFPVDYAIPAAIGTSLGVIVPTALLSAHGHHRQGAVDFHWVRVLLPTILLGALCGAGLAMLLEARWLGRIFGIFEILIALWILFSPKPSARAHPGRGVTAIVGLGIGTISALIGIAGGTLSTPFLLRQGVELRRAIGTASALGVPIAMAGTLGYALPGLLQTVPNAPPGSLGYLYLPAVAGIACGAALTVRLGVWLTHHVPVHLLRQGFALLLLLAGILMLTR